jgi:hypothetical protein
MGGTAASSGTWSPWTMLRPHPKMNNDDHNLTFQHCIEIIAVLNTPFSQTARAQFSWLVASCVDSGGEYRRVPVEDSQGDSLSLPIAPAALAVTVSLSVTRPPEREFLPVHIQ